MNQPAPASPTPLDEPHYTAGLKAYNNQEYNEAIEPFKKALHFDYDNPNTHVHLALCYHNLGQLDRAIDHYQIAGLLCPTHTETFLNLSKARFHTKRYREAHSAARQARKFAQDPQNLQILKQLAATISQLHEYDINRYFVDEVTACFENLQIKTNTLVRVAQDLFLHQAVNKKLLSELQGTRFNDFLSLLKDKTLNWSILNYSLFTNLFQREIIWHKDVESLLTAMRRHMIELAVKHPLNEGILWPSAIDFICGIANQCFINEYIYAADDQEHEWVNVVQTRIAEAINQGKTAHPYDIAILACYKPLHTLEFANKLTENTQNAPTPLSNLLRIQIIEPHQELEIKANLKILTTIDDEISNLVKQQYETHPYPRWVNTSVEDTSSLRRHFKHQFPHLDNEKYPPEDLKPEILIAGCGTGKQPIETALVFENSHITAIDITSSSLAYAQRKTNEMGMDKVIDYGVADILKLKELNRTFDSVHCGGVLHHMRDPMAGWKVLADIVKPGGFMYIGLYSEIARRRIVAAREYILQQGIDDSDNGIREMRAHIKKLPEKHPMKGIMNIQDFYTMAQCRDLLFHVQEHRFTTLALKKSIDELGLEFLGFQLPNNEILPKYRTMFPDDPNAINLKNWHQFELKNPNTFVGMYQFWLHKPR